jgi:replication factor C small subunit
MRYIKEFFNYIKEEWSKNEPIPEILDKEKGLAVFLIGAPGIGKCLEYNTPILVNNKMTKIGKLIDNYNTESKIGEINIPVKNLYVKSLNDSGEFVENEISSLYRGYSEKLINIKTQTGVDIKVTPIHPLLVLEKNGDIIWKKSSEITIDDKLARPRIINNTFNNKSKISNELSRIIGYSLSDGNFIKNKNSKFLTLTNIDIDIIDDFRKCVEKENKILTVKSKKIRHSVQYSDDIKLGNRRFKKDKYDFISNISEICGDYIFGNKSHKVRIPDDIISNSESLKHFLGSYLSCDGSVFENRVEYYTSSYEMATDLSYALLMFNLLL